MSRAREKGSILITVLFVMMVLSLLAVSFAYATALRSRRVVQQGIMVRLRGQAVSAARIALARLGAQHANFDHPAQPWSSHVPLAQEDWFAEWAQNGSQPAEFVADYTVVDEEGKLSLPFASEEQLLKLGMTRDQIAAYTDWTDQDDIARTGGAETDYYSLQRFPYRSKNRGIEMLEELSLVRGFHDVNLYGSHIFPHAGLKQLGGEALDLPDGQLGLIDLISAVEHRKINLNTAPAAVIRALPISAAAMDQILEYRIIGNSAQRIEDHAFRSEEDIEQLQGLTDADRDVLKNLGAFSSEHFRIFAYAAHRSSGLWCRLEVLARRGKNGLEVVEWKQWP